jgi:hypothetical protein
VAAKTDVLKRKTTKQDDPRKTPSPVEAKKPKQEPKQEAAYVSADGKVSFDRYGRQLGAKQEQAPQQEQRNSDDYIVPRSQHPDNAVYVARDKKSGAEVSFDASGRKLDSLGHVVAGDRQRAGDAGAKEIYRPPAPAPEFKSSPSVGATMTRGGTGAGGSARSGWDNSILPGASAGSYDVPQRGAANFGDEHFGWDRWPATRGWESGGNQQRRLRTGQAGTPVAPQMGPQEETAWRTGWGAQNEVRMPWESFAGEYVSPITREPMEAIPGYGMVPTANIPMQTGGLAMPQIYDPQGPRRDMPVEDTYQGYVPQGGMYDPQGRRRR